MPAMPNTQEISLDLTTQELLAMPEVETMLECDDLAILGTLLAPSTVVANAASAPVCDDDSIEIELTAEQINAFLEGRWQP